MHINVLGHIRVFSAYIWPYLAIWMYSAPGDISVFDEGHVFCGERSLPIEMDNEAIRPASLVFSCSQGRDVVWHCVPDDVLLGFLNVAGRAWQQVWLKGCLELYLEYLSRILCGRLRLKGVWRASWKVLRLPWGGFGSVLECFWDSKGV